MMISGVFLLGLTTTLPSVNMVLAETVSETETPSSTSEKPALPYDDLITPPSTSSSETEEANVEEPTFSLKEEQMTGSVGKVVQVMILVDRPIDQVQVTIPQDLKVQQEDIPEGMEATQMTETEWWFAAEESTEFIIPILSETAGNYTLRIEDHIDGTIEFEESEEQPAEEELETPKEQENVDEEKATPEVEEEAPDQEVEEVTPATTSNVSTWAQYQTALTTSSVTQINILASFSADTSTTVIPINRNLLINGNGFSVNYNNRRLQINSSISLTIRNMTIRHNLTGNNSHIQMNAANARVILSDITFNESSRLVGQTGLAAGVQTFVTFDGGNSNFIDNNMDSLLAGVTTVRLTNNAQVNVKNSIFLNTLVDTSSTMRRNNSITIDKGSSLSIDNGLSEWMALRTTVLIVDGSLNAITNTTAIYGNGQSGRQLMIILGAEGKTYVKQNSTRPIIENSLDSLPDDTSLTIEEGTQFDLINSAGGPILNNTRTNNVQLTTENLAVWNRGRTSSTPSQNFENIEAQLTGANAATITSTNHNVFRATYSKQGLNGYSRISSSGIAGETTVDPLEPDTEIDPDNPPVIPENQGNFRLDFVSQFTFGSHESNLFEEQTYYALPQYGLDSNGEVIESEPRPNFVQITDNRADADGWQLSVTQREQFKTETGNELSGASLQLKNRQLVADHDGQQPREATTEETIILEPGAKQPLLTSSTGEGKGTWIYRFGDGTSSDQSVALVVPKETIPEATTYQTKLDWELQAVPGNE